MAAADPPASPPPRPPRPRLLLAASVAVPALFFAWAAWQDHARLMAAARGTVERATALAREHALKVTETNLLVLDRVEDRVRGLDWDAIERQQEAVHRDLRAIDERIEQIASLHLVAPDGRIAAVSTLFPAPSVPIADRPYFKRHAAGEPGPLFGEPIVSRVTGKVGFTMTRRRAGPDGAFDGVVFGSFLPDHFRRHWEVLAAGADIHLALLRTDGRPLAQLPAPPDPASAPPLDQDLVRSVAAADEGVVVVGSWADGAERLVAFGRVGRHPLHVVSALSLQAVRAEWRRDLAGIGAGCALAALCLASLALRAGRRWRAAQDALFRHMATHDALTGLPNRVELQERLDRLLARSGRDGRPVALLAVDLDRFKPVNDLHGHAAGDALLRLVAERLRSAARGADAVARVGGDEFVVAARVADEGGARALAERVVAALEAPFALEEATVRVGCSVGVALNSPADAAAEILAQRADAALYRAKAEGRNRVRVFDPGLDARVRDGAALAADLRHAVLDGDVEPHFQPLVEIGTGRVVGFEMLARWPHPTRGMVPPSEFIPAAEEAGLIAPLAEGLLRRACAAAAAWPGDLKLACNVSPLQLRDRALPWAVRAALAESGLPARRLELELTEGALVPDFALAREILAELKGLGVRLALDDFGTGHASLGALLGLPFDRVKIDRSFLRGLGAADGSGGGGGAAVVGAVAGLCRGLGLAVTAEGIEEGGQLAWLAAEGSVAEGQGWLFGRPVPAAEVPRLLARTAPQAAERPRESVEGR